MKQEPNAQNGDSSASNTHLTHIHNRVKTVLERVSTSINRPSQSQKVSPILAGIVLGLSIALVIVIFRPLTPAQDQASADKTTDTDWFQQAYDHSKRGNRQAAIADYTQAIQKDPKNSNFYYNRGIEYAATGDKPRAIADYTQAIKLDKNFADAYYNRANANVATGNQQEAIADYQRAADLYQKQGLTQFQQEAIAAARKLQSPSGQ